MVRLFLSVTLLSVLPICTIAYAQEKSEEITLSTYYPAPYGDYDWLSGDRVIVNRQIVGDMDVDRDGDDSDLDDITAVPGGNLLIKGNVGIGTTAPNAKLELNRTSGSAPRLRLGYLVGSAYGEIYSSGNLKKGLTIDSVHTGANNAASTRFRHSTDSGSSYTDSLFLQYNGNVGIGTTEPAAKLDVKGGPVSIFGSWTLYDSNGDRLVLEATYRATSDGFVTLSGSTSPGTGEIGVAAFVDDVYPVVGSYNQKTRDFQPGPSWQGVGLSFPVRKSDYWRISLYAGDAGTGEKWISWLPLGDGESIRQ